MTFRELWNNINKTIIELMDIHDEEIIKLNSLFLI